MKVLERMSYESWADVYDTFYADITADIPFYLDAARQHGSPILELGIETGRIAIPLAEVGYEVWGLDNSPTMLERVRRKIARLLIRQILIHSDPSRSSRYDTSMRGIICVNNE